MRLQRCGSSGKGQTEVKGCMYHVFHISAKANSFAVRLGSDLYINSAVSAQSEYSDHNCVATTIIPELNFNVSMA